MNKELAKKRLDYLRQEIEAERISTSEILQLQSLIPYIDKDDVLLLEWAGVEEFGDIDEILKKIWDLSDTNVRIHIRALQRALINNL